MSKTRIGTLGTWGRSLVLVLGVVLGAGILWSCGTSSDSTTSPTAPSSSPTAPKGASMFTISSPAFENGGLIPVEYATKAVPGGTNRSIPYEWRDPPEGTKSFALVLVDRAPVARNWVHWMVVDIPATVTSLPAGASPTSMPPGSRELDNTFGSVGYGGPQPPQRTGRHPYEATLYALDVGQVPLSARTDLASFLRAISGHVLAEAQVTGVMSR